MQEGTEGVTHMGRCSGALWVRATRLLPSESGSGHYQHKVGVQDSLEPGSSKRFTSEIWKLCSLFGQRIQNQIHLWNTFCPGHLE